jgi:hypothetical protein
MFGPSVTLGDYLVADEEPLPRILFSSDALPREAFGVCGTPERWMVHHNDKWMPLSASYIAFLMGINRKLPDVKSKCLGLIEDAPRQPFIILNLRGRRFRRSKTAA